MARPSKDIDVVVVGSGIAMAQALGKKLGRGAHGSVFKNFGTAQVKYQMCIRDRCHTLHLTLSTGYSTVRSIKSNNCILTVACAVIFIHNSTSREDMPQSITDNRRVEVLDVYKRQAIKRVFIS